MEPALSRRSIAGSALSVPSDAVRSRLRNRLRQSGAFVSSQSVASRAEVLTHFEPVDVGEGREATSVEQLLARLEQHGLRRRLTAEDDAGAYAVDVVVRAAEMDEEHEEHPHNTYNGSSSHTNSSVSRSASSAGRGDPDAREPYYYLCVPCELRLSRFSTRPPAWRVLEDAHFHFSSAAHRSTASWMMDEDIDKTLRASPLVEPPGYYSRVFLNGIPTLLSRRPGGGDMFHPLPHEEKAVRPPRGMRRGAARAEGGDVSRASSVDTDCHHHDWLFPSPTQRGEEGGESVLWHRPLTSTYTGMVQLVRRFAVTSTAAGKDLRRASRFRVQRAPGRALVGVDHVSRDDYQAQMPFPASLLPLTPVLLPVRRSRVAKVLLLNLFTSPAGAETGLKRLRDTGPESISEDDPHRAIYTQSCVPLATQLSGGDGDAVDSAAATPLPQPVTVFEEACYRVALASTEELEVWQRHPLLPPAEEAASLTLAEATEASPVVLTLELLTQHTQAATQARSSRGWSRDSSVVGSASLLSHSVSNSESSGEAIEESA